MSFKVCATADFLKSLKALSKRCKSVKDDFLNLTKSLENNPYQGIELSPGIRKLRMTISSKGRGKSGGARVITYTIAISQDSGSVFLIDIYDKADYSTVDIDIIQKNLKDLGL